MIYLDLTQAASSPKQTGVERFQRGFFRMLAGREKVCPIVWDKIKGSYCDLTDGEWNFLKDPFTQVVSGVKKPEASGLLHLLLPCVRWASHWGKKIREVQGRDVLVCTEHFTDGRVSEVKEKPWKNIRKISVFHDAIPLLDAQEKGEKSPFENYIEAISAFDLVVCTTRESEGHLRRALASQNLQIPRIEVLELPIDFSENRPPIIPSQKKEILFVSSFNPRKNHRTLLDACEVLWKDGMEFDLVLIGRTGKGSEAIERMVLDRAKNRPIRWLRHVNDELLKKQYQQCAFTVFPSTREGFGLPIIESLWYSKPCICSDQGAIGEVSAGGGCVQVNVMDAQALSEVMKTLLTDFEKYRVLQNEAACRKFVTWDNYLEKWSAATESIWDDACSKNGF